MSAAASPRLLGALLCCLLWTSACRTTPTLRTESGRYPGACQEDEYVGESPIRRTRYGWRAGQRAWRQEMPPEGREGTAGPRERYTYFDDGTVLLPLQDSGVAHRYGLRMLTGPVDHQWALQAESVRQARALYGTGPGGRVTWVDAGGSPRLAYEDGPDGVLVQVRVQCGTSARSVRWRYGEGGEVTEMAVDMGSGLADTRFVMEYSGGRRAVQRVLRRGEGLAAATPAMVYDCSPWLGAGRGVYEEPAAPDVLTYKALGETRYTYDDIGNLIQEEATHVAGLNTTVTYAYDSAGNLLRRDTETEREARRTVRYSYACWR